MAQASAGRLKQTGLRKRKVWPQCRKASSWQGRQRCFCQNKKEHSHLLRSSNRKIGDSQGEQEGNQSGSMGGKDELHNEGRRVSRRRGRQAKRAFVGEVGKA